MYLLLATPRQKNLLSQIPQILPWHEPEYFWKTMAKPWQRASASLLTVLGYFLMALFLAATFGILNLLSASLS